MKIIFYELNEVPSNIFNHFACLQDYPAFNKLKKTGRLFESVSSDIGHLSPWVTWPSVHRGVANTDHQITSLGQNLTNINKMFPPIWELLTSNGCKVGLFGPLHSYPMPQNLENYEFYVPDTFSLSSECSPRILESFQKFNLKMVSSNGKNVSSKFFLIDAFDFIINLRKIGVRKKTILKIVKQVISEQFNKNNLVRRRTTQSQLSFDIFLNQLTLKKPDASFFFTNHVASTLHRYWPSIFPNDYPSEMFGEEWLNTWKNEIPLAVKEADNQLLDLMEFIDRNPGYQLAVISSMGQAAVRDSRPLFNQVMITDITKFMQYFGISKSDWSPKLAMAPEIVVNFKHSNPEKLLENAKKIRINGSNLDINFLGSGDVLIVVNIGNADDLLVVDGSNNRIEPSSIGIEIVDLQDAAGCNAYHIPEGIFVLYGHHKNNNPNWERVSTLDIAPSILNNFGLTVPNYMKGNRSLFSER